MNTDPSLASAPSIMEQIAPPPRYRPRPEESKARILVAIGPGVQTENLIRWTHKTAASLSCPWLAVWVETSRDLSTEEREQLTRSLSLARKLGAEVTSISGDCIADTLLKVARERGVSQIVAGKPARNSWFRTSVAERLLRNSGSIEISAIHPEAGDGEREPETRIKAPMPLSLKKEYAWVISMAVMLNLIGWAVFHVTGYVFVGLLILLAVIFAAFHFSRGPVMALTTLGALSWDFFFIEPHFGFYPTKPQDILLFGLFFLVAVTMVNLTSRLREREQAEARRQRQTEALLRVTQSAALTAEPEKGLHEAMEIIANLLHGDVALVVRRNRGELAEAAHSASTFSPAEHEMHVVNWAFRHKQPSGRFTEMSPESSATWFPLQTSTSVMGVLGVRLPPTAVLDFGARLSVEAFAVQLALVLEKQHFVEAISHAEVVAETERLQRSLLDCVSHELKTPLAVIQAALDGLQDTKNPYVHEIHTASRRLQRVVHNLLQMTRIESSAISPARDWCLVSEILSRAIELTGEDLAKRPLGMDIPPDLPPLKADPNFCVQAVANILDNAAIYTPEGTPVEVSAALKTPNILILSIADRGPGFGPGEEERVFQKFYRSPGSPSGGTGLGLSIARALVRSFGGDIQARNRAGGGAEFLLTLPVEPLPQ